jgi:hypothetical protein
MRWPDSSPVPLPWETPPPLCRSRPAWHNLTSEQREMIHRALTRLLARYLLPMRDIDKEVKCRSVQQYRSSWRTSLPCSCPKSFHKSRFTL